MIALFLTTLALGAPASAETPIAKVGERVITLEEIQRDVRSLPFGESTPGAPGQGLEVENQGRLFLEVLNETIDAELLYLEAKRLGVDGWPEFQREATAYREAALADIYREKIFAKQVIVDHDSINSFAKEQGVTRKAAEAILRSKMRDSALAAEIGCLFDSYGVAFTPIVAKKEMKEFEDNDLLAYSEAFKIFYRDVRGPFSNFGSDKQALLDLLAQMLEVKLLAAEAEKAGLDEGEDFRLSLGEYEKSLAINLYRNKLRREKTPSEKDVEKYISGNPHLRYHPRKAAVLMIVSKTKQEAERLREKALSGANFHKLAIENSIAPNAKINAGDIGPMTIGARPYTVVDEALLSIKPGQITPPIEGEHGFSIFKLLEITDKKPRPDEEVQKAAEEALLEANMNEYLEKLRRSGAVEILTTDVAESGERAPAN